MTRLIIFIVILGGAVAAFVFYINPHYQNITMLRQTTSSYTAALDNADKLKAASEELKARYNAIPQDQLDAVKTVLPDNVDNIRLIIQLNSIALKTGMSSLRDVNYSSDQGTGTQPQPTDATANNGKLYGNFQISFSTTGSYKNFLDFLSTLEDNLRLVDVTRVSFDVLEDPTKGVTDYNKYTITLNTYWLKN